MWGSLLQLAELGGTTNCVPDPGVQAGWPTDLLWAVRQGLCAMSMPSYCLAALLCTARFTCRWKTRGRLERQHWGS